MNTVDSQEYNKKYRESVLERAAHYDAEGETEEARVLLTNAIQNGNWSRATLWWRLVALMKAPSDYQHIRDLWLLSPASARDNQSVMRAVARAAAVSGHHHECRVLLRKLIRMLTARQPSQHLGKPRTAQRRENNPARDEAKFTEAAAEALRDLNAAFEDISLKMFLISGTLLGLVREGKFIGWDKDIDVGYFSEDCQIDLESHFRSSTHFRVGRVDLTSDRLRLIHTNGTWVDVFPHYMENGQRWHDGTATRWANTPFGLKRTRFIGVDQYIPENPEIYLEENYGNWRTPTSNFDARLDAPNVEVTDYNHFTSLIYFSIEKCMRTGKIEMLHRYQSLI